MSSEMKLVHLFNHRLTLFVSPPPPRLMYAFAFADRFPLYSPASKSSIPSSAICAASVGSTYPTCHLPPPPPVVTAMMTAFLVKCGRVSNPSFSSEASEISRVDGQPPGE